MSRSATSSPLRKKSRLSSPTYDAHFDELDSYDFQALDEIETSFSRSGGTSSIKPTSRVFDRKECRKRAIEDALNIVRLEHNEDSGIVLVDSEGRSESALPTLPASHPQPSVFHPLGSNSTTLLPLVEVPTDHVPYVPNSGFAGFFPVSHLVSADSLKYDLRRSPSPENPEYHHDGWFAPAEMSSPTARTFTSASALQGVPSRTTRAAIEFDSPNIGAISSTSLQHRSKSTWASPSTNALEQAKKRLLKWEVEIDTEMSVVECGHELVSDMHNDMHPIINRKPLKGVENSASSPATSARAPVTSVLPTQLDSHPTDVPPHPFKPPSFTIPRSNNTPSRPLEVHLTSVVSRSSAAADVASRTPFSLPPVTPIRSNSFSSHSQPQTPKPPVVPMQPESSQRPTMTPQKSRPLGLSPRAHAFTSSRARPKFVTPFKQGMKPGDKTASYLPVSKPTNQRRSEEKGKGREVIPSMPEATKVHINNCNEPSIHMNRIALVDSKLVPRHCSQDQFNEMKLDVELSNLTSVSNFLRYRFDTMTNADAIPTQLFLGSDSALEALLAMDYHLATKPWVDNHWSLILWKMLGMACLEPAKVKKRWCWDEVMRQLCYRYKHELAGGSRPALKLIAAQDAPASGPLVLCISNIFWPNEYVGDHGQPLASYPELEITDGWYRLRATVDEALARAARNNVLRVGRKIACSGAKLESSKKDPTEVLDAYGSTHLILSGNSTHLAPWHARLGFQRTPFVATLGSLTSDGGGVSLTDLIITQVFPVAFIEFITTENGESVCEGPRTEQDECLEEDRWNKRRSHEVAKLYEKLEEKCHRLESYANRLEQIAGGEFCPTEDESTPDNIEDLVEELEDCEDPSHIIKAVSKGDARWLSLLLRRKCESHRENSGDAFQRELASSFPARQVRNFRVLQVKDAQTSRKPSYRTAQLTVWDVMSLNVTEGESPGSFVAGQRYLVSSLVPSNQSAWMGLEPDSEIYLNTRRDSKWKLIS